MSRGDYWQLMSGIWFQDKLQYILMEKLYDDLIKQLIEIGLTEIIPSIPESEFSYLREGQWPNFVSSVREVLLMASRVQ